MGSPRLGNLLSQVDRRWWVTAVLAAMSVLPFLVSDYYITLTIFILINALFAQSFNLLFGYVGKLSFGQAAYFGISAYTVGIMMLKVNAPFLVCVISGVIASGLFAVVIGYICVRLVGMYFAILTMAFGQIVFVIVDKWYKLTGGHDGIQGISLPSVLENIRIHYFYILIIIVSAMALIYRIVESPFGYTLRAIRDNPTRSEFNGVNVNRLQLIAFTLSGMFAGLAGSLFAPFNRSLAPAILDWTKSSEPVIMTIIGGQYVFLGPIVGSAIFTILQYVILEFTMYWPFVIGVVLILMVVFLPGGLVGFMTEKITGTKVPEL